MDHWLAFCIGRRNHDSTGSNRGIESAYLYRRSLVCGISPSFCTYCVADSKDAMGIDLSPLHANASSSLCANHPRLPFLFFGPDILGYNLER